MSEAGGITMPGAAYSEVSRDPTPAEEQAYHRNMRVLYQRALQKKDWIIQHKRGMSPARFQAWYDEVVDGIVLLSEEYENMDDVEDDGKDKRFLNKITTYWRNFLMERDDRPHRPYEEVWTFVAGSPLHLE
ncbi:MAG: hypothetical protein Q9167_002960 [Letrouitia subvulpina]